MNQCACCGRYVPDGVMVCSVCWNREMQTESPFWSESDRVTEYDKNPQKSFAKSKENVR